MRWFKIYGERWFMGTTRWELTAEQRAVWIDLLARASINDPPGQIDYYSLEQLAQQFNVDLELLESTIKRCVEERKIKYFKNKLKILISNWKKYQSEYQRQKPYRKKDESQSEVTEKGDNSCNKVTLREEGEEKRIDTDEKEIKGKEKNENNKSFPSHPKDQFLFILEEFSKEYPYKFNEDADGQIYDLSVRTYRNVDPIRELEKKIEYWKKNPGALQSKGKSPRVQLHEFLEKEAEYQDGVLEKEKSLDRERNDG